MTEPTNDMQFPEWFPHSCPPEDAEDATGIVYRFVRNNPCEEDDFLTHHELGLAPKASACSRCGLSVYRKLDAARAKLLELIERFPARFGPHIAEGFLRPELGQMKQEGRDAEHYEWWVYRGVSRQQPFRVVETLPSWRRSE